MEATVSRHVWNVASQFERMQLSHKGADSYLLQGATRQCGSNVREVRMRKIPADLVQRYEKEGWWAPETFGAMLARGLAASPGTVFRVHSASTPRPLSGGSPGPPSPGWPSCGTTSAGRAWPGRSGQRSCTSWTTSRGPRAAKSRSSFSGSALRRIKQENKILITSNGESHAIEAIAELDWAVERGARAILVRPAPVPGFRGSRSFALPEFDPFWQRCVEHGVLVAMHSSDSGYARYAQDWEGSSSEMLPFVANAFRSVAEWRPVTDAVASWVCHGGLFRNPELKVAVIENGSAWLVPLLDQLASTYKRCRKASWATRWRRSGTGSTSARSGRRT